MIVAPSGNLHSVYQKHFLYETDEAWAEPGPSFTTVTLPFPSSNPASSSPPPSSTFTLAPCICMDLNPERFLAPFEDFEFATFVRDAHPKVDVVVGTMAWLASPPGEDDSDDSGSEDDSDWADVLSTINYWAVRLTPLIGSRTAIVVCNRIGTEGGTCTFCFLRVMSPC